MIKEIKNLYEKILELNLQINLMLNNFPKDDFESFNENLQDFLEQKDIFIQKLISLSKTANEEDLKEISERVHKIEEENLRLIQEKKHYLSTEINKNDIKTFINVNIQINNFNDVEYSKMNPKNISQSILKLKLSLNSTSKKSARSRKANKDSNS